MAATLATLFDDLDALTQRPPLDELTSQLARIEIACEDVADFIRFSNRGYTRNLVRTGRWYHVLVLCWKNGQRSPIHDHLGSVCALRVLRGTLTETRFEFAANGLVKAVASREFAAGAVIGSRELDLHQVSNLQPGAADLVTLHVYSPPLLEMGTHSLTDPARGIEPMFVDFIDAAGI